MRRLVRLTLISALLVVALAIQRPPESEDDDNGKADVQDESDAVCKDKKTRVHASSPQEEPSEKPVHMRKRLINDPSLMTTTIIAMLIIATSRIPIVRMLLRPPFTSFLC